mmetsp:Transcript_66600/g.124291  ORF Transcript_66600/g.124291 Transcript_66600/m.124291 type:complete len:311 (+) Transcript_66600:63-995(+)
MAALWSMLREEVVGTVNEFREKGAIGAFKDAALDACDMVADAGQFVVNEASSLIVGDEEPVLYTMQLPEDGQEVMLRAGNRFVAAQVIALDTVSNPARAKVRLSDGAFIVVPVLPMDVAMSQAQQQQLQQLEQNPAHNAADDGGMLWVLNGLKQELQSTVQEFQQKGAVGALRDATLDAVDLLGEGAMDAVDLIGEGAQMVGDTTVDLLGIDSTPKPAPAALPAPAQAPAVQAPQHWKPDVQTEALARDLEGTHLDSKGSKPAQNMTIPAGAQQFDIADEPDVDEVPAAAPAAGASQKASNNTEHEELID